MRDHREHAAEADDIAPLIDVPFYSGEVGTAFTSSEEAGRHFLSLGHAQDLSPSPFFLWGWIRAQRAAPADVDTFLADPSQACAHPAFAPESYFELCRVAGGDVPTLVALLSRIEVDHGLLLPGFVGAARTHGQRGLRAFLASLTTQHFGGPGLEMPHFSSTWYHDAYDDVARAKANPFRHYVVSGWREGRDPSPNFSTPAYLSRHPDVIALGDQSPDPLSRQGRGRGPLGRRLDCLSRPRPARDQARPAAQRLRPLQGWKRCRDPAHLRRPRRRAF